MSACCSGGCASPTPAPDRRYRRILWIALAVNAAMFLVELIGGWHAGSVSLLADAIDFLGDAVNYGLSLAALGMAVVWAHYGGLRRCHSREGRMDYDARDGA